MTGTAKINNPGELSVTISLTATLSEWQRLSEQFAVEKAHHFPACDLIRAVRNLTYSATEEVSEKERPID